MPVVYIYVLGSGTEQYLEIYILFPHLKLSEDIRFILFVLYVTRIGHVIYARRIYILSTLYWKNNNYLIINTRYVLYSDIRIRVTARINTFKPKLVDCYLIKILS